MSKSLVLAAYCSSDTPDRHELFNTKIGVRITYRIILSIQSSAVQEISETELTQARSSKQDDHNLKKIARLVKFPATESTGNKMALAVVKRGLWAIVGVIILKVMTFCEGISGTVDFAQLAVQRVDFLQRLF